MKIAEKDREAWLKVLLERPPPRVTRGGLVTDMRPSGEVVGKCVPFRVMSIFWTPGIR